ncbi:hypothetical protein NSMM_180002 [Nitrosomonas mobilis]|uniref:Uncharacterized protein n=1 Tax=Nitrosomonas mobilis TaxID=51642 RepID=A0A1G5SB83_9PROT|nr:hypothetical protein NSMM_180002 [Nitrosomonas mobilis]
MVWQVFALNFQPAEIVHCLTTHALFVAILIASIVLSGTDVQINVSPLEFMLRLAALVPRPNLIRFHAMLAPNAKLRFEIILGSRKTKVIHPAGMILCHFPRLPCVSVGRVYSSGCSMLTLSIARIAGEP